MPKKHPKPLPTLFLSPPLWRLNIEELYGHNIETEGRAIVNGKLREGWVLLHIYTLAYKEDGLVRQRPMAILGKPKKIPITTN